MVATMERGTTHELDPELTAEIDACTHFWVYPWWWRILHRGVVRCTARCGARISGGLAERPPRHGMDWNTSALVRRS